MSNLVLEAFDFPSEYEDADIQKAINELKKTSISNPISAAASPLITPQKVEVIVEPQTPTPPAGRGRGRGRGKPSESPSPSAVSPAPTPASPSLPAPSPSTPASSNSTNTTVAAPTTPKSPVASAQLENLNKYKKEDEDLVFTQIRWMGPRNAQVIFSNQEDANTVLQTQHPVIKFRKYESKQVKSPDRPQTTAVVARRLIAGALGVKINVSPEQKEKEQRQLDEAREQKKNEKKEKYREAQKEDDEDYGDW